jgi:hypothetical protein
VETINPLDPGESPAESPTDVGKASGPASGRREEVLPVPAGPLISSVGSGQKPSIWKRISMRRRGGENGPAAAHSIDRINTRLDILESRIQTLHEDVGSGLRRIEGRMDEVWESEEQLSHLVEIQERLESLSKTQREVLENQQQIAKTGEGFARRAFLIVALGLMFAILGLALSGSVSLN